MDAWKILGGVAIGVGAVAAAPFTGGGSVLAGATALSSLAGAGTIAAAVGAGAVGAGVGAKMAYDEEQEKEEERKKQAEQNLRLQKMEEALKDAEPQLKEQEDYFNLLWEGVSFYNINNQFNLSRIPTKRLIEIKNKLLV